MWIDTGGRRDHGLKMMIYLKTVQSGWFQLSCARLELFSVIVQQGNCGQSYVLL